MKTKMNNEYRTKNNEPQKLNFIIRYSLFSIHYLFFLFLCLLPSAFLHGQAKIDSLNLALKTAKEDTNKVNALNVFAAEFIMINIDTTIKAADEALVLAKKIKWKKGMCVAYYLLGWSNFQKANYPLALEYNLKALKIGEEINYNKGISDALGNIGAIYYTQSDYPKALEFYFRALKISEEIGNKEKIARHLGNIGLVYGTQSNYSKALEYHHKSLRIRNELGNKNRIAYNLGYIGHVYHNQADDHTVPDSSYKLYLKAAEYYSKTIQIAKEVDNDNLVAIYSGGLGSLYFKMKKYKDAEAALINAISLCEQVRALNYTRDFELNLSQLYDTTGRYQLALEHYKKYVTARDSITNEENTKKQTRLEMQYEFDKKEAAAKAEQEKKEAVAAAEAKKQRFVLLLVSCFLLLVLVFAVFIFRALRITQKQKKVIERQKKVVEEKQEEILASIRYAKRIQDALLPTEKYIHKHLERLRAKMPK